MRHWLLAGLLALASLAPAQVACTWGATGLTALTWDNGQGGGPVSYWDSTGGAFKPTLNFVSSITSGGSRVAQSTTSSGSSFAGSTLTQTFPWGTIATTVTCPGSLPNSIDWTTVVTSTLSGAPPNDPSIDRLFINTAGIAFAHAPDATSPNESWNLDSPSAVPFRVTADNITVSYTNTQVTGPLGIGLKLISAGNLRWYLNEEIDTGWNTSTGWPPVNRPIAPGGTDTYTTSLRFGDKTQGNVRLAQDVIQAYAAAHPMTWTDPCLGRPVTGWHLASNVRPTLLLNPRGFKGPTTNPVDVDVTTAAGIASLQQGIINQANSLVTQMNNSGSCGVIAWDAQGAQTEMTYTGNPEGIETMAPELGACQPSVCTGQFLDTLMQVFTTAGLQFGFTLRPQDYSQVTGITVNITGPTVTWVSGTLFDTNWANNNGNVGDSLFANSLWFDTPVLNTATIAAVDSTTSMTIDSHTCFAAGDSDPHALCTTNVTVPAYVFGNQAKLDFVPDFTNAGGAYDIAVSGGAAHGVKLANGTSNPGAGDLAAGQHYLLISDGTNYRINNCTSCSMLYSQMTNDPPNVQSLLAAKITYSRTRWGAFAQQYYVDTNGDGQTPTTDNFIYPATAYCGLLATFPTIVMHPEQSSTLHFTCTSPYREGSFSPPVTEPDQTTQLAYPFNAANPIFYAHGMANMTDSQATAQGQNFRESAYHGNNLEWQVTGGAGRPLAQTMYGLTSNPPTLVLDQ